VDCVGKVLVRWPFFGVLYNVYGRTEDLVFLEPGIGDGDGEFCKADFMFEEKLDVLCPLNNQCTLRPAELAAIVDSIQTRCKAGFFFLSGKTQGQRLDGQEARTRVVNISGRGM